MIIDFRNNGTRDERAEHFLSICAKHNPITITTKDKKTNTVIHRMMGWAKQMNSGIYSCSSVDEVWIKHNTILRAEIHVIFSN